MIPMSRERIYPVGRKPMNTAIYRRVSSDKQTTASQTPDLQAYAMAQQAAGSVVTWFDDKATGKKMNRPGWDRLMAEVRKGSIKRIVVWRLDRLGRTASGLTRLFDELIAAGVTLVSLRDGIDLLTPAGRLIANVLASVAQYETEVRGERIRAGISAKHARGEKWGNGRPAGSAHKATPEVCAQVRRMATEGESKSAIARVCKLSRQTVYTILGGAL
jgi:DNA invertase Pin-like site-specific DNA recombinase